MDVQHQTYSSPIQPAPSYSELIEGLPAAIYTCDAEGRITFYNTAAVALWGREPQIGHDLWCGSWKIYQTNGSPLPLDECPMAITLREGRVVQGYEIVIERPDGVRINVLPHPKPIFDRSGKLIGAINMLVDISDKKITEETLHASEKRYRLLSLSLEKAFDEKTLNLVKSEERYHKMIEEVEDYAILLLDKEGYILNWNKGAEKIKGYPESEILGKNFRIFYMEEDREKKLPEQLITLAKETGKATHEGWRLRKDGSRFWGNIVITALHDERNDIIGFSKVTRDLTEKKMAEDQLKNYANELEFQNKQLEEYAYVASHDLQEPLRKIKTFANLLEKQIEDKEAVKKYIEKINASANRMSALIKDVLDYSQLSPSDELLSLVDLKKVMEQVLEDFDLLIDQKHARVIISGLPQINGIPIQLHQLFSNLFGNALKFTTEDPLIEIYSEKATSTEIEMSPKLLPGIHYYKITVKDNGVGFEQEYADQIFKLFQRLSETSYGTGIGLAICKKIVENHKGHITVSSEPNKGTIFNIYLPAI